MGKLLKEKRKIIYKNLKGVGKNEQSNKRYFNDGTGCYTGNSLLCIAHIFSVHLLAGSYNNCGVWFLHLPEKGIVLH